MNPLNRLQRTLRWIWSEALWRIEVHRNKSELKRLANVYVTPFTPLLLSKWYLSREVNRRGLRFLNRDTRRINPSNARSVNFGDIIYVQVDQLSYFRDRILPKIKVPFTLITGKWQLPELQNSEMLRELSTSNKIISWWSQNQVFKNLGISPFPYGLDLFSLITVEAFIKDPRSQQGNRPNEVMVPYVGIHSHLLGRALKTRVGLSSFMAPKVPLGEYLSAMLDHKFVLSPAGDRPDTHRHYESVAMGCRPVSDQEAGLREIFADSMLFVEDLPSVAKFPGNLSVNSIWPPDRKLIYVQTWRARVARDASLTSASEVRPETAKRVPE